MAKSLVVVGKFGPLFDGAVINIQGGHMFGQGLHLYPGQEQHFWAAIPQMSILSHAYDAAIDSHLNGRSVLTIENMEAPTMDELELLAARITQAYEAEFTFLDFPASRIIEEVEISLEEMGAELYDIWH